MTEYDRMDRMYTSNDAHEHTYKLSARWSDDVADYRYTLTVFDELETGERRICNTFSGDVDWASRIMTHHNIELPEEEKK